MKSNFKVRASPRPSRLAEFLGLVTNDVETGMLASKVSCLHEILTKQKSTTSSHRVVFN